MVFGNGVKNIQAAAYNGARTVYCSKNMNGLRCDCELTLTWGLQRLGFILENKVVCMSVLLNLKLVKNFINTSCLIEYHKYLIKQLFSN